MNVITKLNKLLYSQFGLHIFGSMFKQNKTETNLDRKQLKGKKNTNGEIKLKRSMCLVSQKECEANLEKLQDRINF